MTRKHYKIIAEAFRESKPSTEITDWITDSNDQHELWEEIVTTVAEALNNNNANFNSDMFYKACGMGAK
jgi:hypothetical protein